MEHPIRLVCSACAAVHRLAHLTPGKTYHCKKCGDSLRTADPAWMVCARCGHAAGPAETDLGKIHACPTCPEGTPLETRFSPPPAPVLPDPLLNTPGEALTQAVDEAVDRVLERAFGEERVESLARRIEKPLEEELARRWETSLAESLAPRIEAALREKLSDAVRNSGLPDLAEDLKLQVRETLERIEPKELPAPPPPFADEASRAAVADLVVRQVRAALADWDSETDLAGPVREAVTRLLEERLPTEPPSPLENEESRAAWRTLVVESTGEAIRQSGLGDVPREVRDGLAATVREAVAESLPEAKSVTLDETTADALAERVGERLGATLGDSLAGAVSRRLEEQTESTLLPRLIEAVPAQSAMALRDLLRTELGQAVGEAVEEAGLGQIAERIRKTVSAHVRQSLDDQLREQLGATLREQSGEMMERAVRRVHEPLVAEIQQTRSSIPLWLAGLLVLPVLALMGVLLAWALTAGSEAEMELAKQRHIIERLSRNLEDMHDELARSRKELDQVEQAAWNMNKRAKAMELKLRALGHDPDILATDTSAAAGESGR